MLVQLPAHVAVAHYLLTGDRKLYSLFGLKARN